MNSPKTDFERFLNNLFFHGKNANHEVFVYEKCIISLLTFKN